MRVAAVHTYVGGFLFGLENEPDVEIVADYESWPHGMKAATALGLPVRPLDSKKVRADIVVANPPCSRFSNFTQKGSFEGDDYVHVKNFCELEDVVNVVGECKARTLWWETGPLCWNKGRALLANLHAHFTKSWGRCQTLLIHYDTRYGGVPQRRPRCHIVHTAVAAQTPPKVIGAMWPIKQRVKTWVDTEVHKAGSRLDLPCYLDGQGLALRGESPLKFAKLCEFIGGYQSARPRIIHPDDEYAHSVVSRPMLWDVEDRWLDIAELAALQCYPISAYTDYIRTVKQRYMGITLLSKSVSPSASRFLWRYLIRPWLFNEDGETDTNSVEAVQYSRNMFEIRLAVRDNRKSKEQA